MNISNIDKSKMLKLLIAGEIICFALAIGEWIYIQKTNVTELTRPDFGQGSNEEELEYSLGNYSDSMTVTVEEKALSKTQQTKYIEAAKKEIDRSFKGHNKSLNNVTSNLCMEEEYQDGIVEAEWYFDNYKVITADGEIIYDAIEKATVVNASVTLTCQDTSQVYEFPFMVKPLSKSSIVGIKYYISKMISQADDKCDSLQLPSSLGDKTITWKRKYSFLGIKLGALILASFIAVKLGQKFEEKRNIQSIQDQMKRDYPKIVESLSLYVGAGLSVKNAFYRIVEEYSRKGVCSAGFDGIYRMCKLIEDGKSEMEAYRSLASLCPIKEYRRLSLILISNAKKGTKGLIDILEKEEVDSFEAQKQYVRILGEEASTKLLIPMVGLMGIVLVIVIVPAMANMNF